MARCSTRGRLLVSLVAAITFGWIAPTRGLAEAARPLNVPAQDLGNALRALGAAANEQILFSEDIVAGLRSKALRGRYTTEQALSILLKGLGLHIRRTPSGVLLVLSDTPSQSPQPSERPHSHKIERSVAESDAAVLEEVEVTGSLLRISADAVTPFPLMSISRTELERRGVNRLGDIRWAVPQLGASVGFNENLLNTGLSRAQGASTSLNMRGLGGNSTLVLVNGRRVPHTGQEAPGAAGGREDFSIDGIPVSAIERIEVLPQGAGAIYGAEAIAGVVNVILKKNFTGVEAEILHDGTTAGGGSQQGLRFAAGHRHEAFSVFAGVTWEEQHPLAARDRWFSRTVDYSRFGGSDSYYRSGPISGSGALSSLDESSLPGLDTSIVAIPKGSKGSGVTVDQYALAGGAAAPFDEAAYTDLIDPSRSRSVILNADYEISSGLKPYLESRWSRFEDSYTGAPLTLSMFLHDGYPDNPFSTPVMLRKVFYDLPRPRTQSSQENSSLTLGSEGYILRAWRYDISATRARNIAKDEAITGTFDSSRLIDAMSSLYGQPILAYDSTVPGNDPNPPGVLQSLTPAFDHRDVTTLYQYAAQMDGPVWSGWAGELELALGAELQQEKVSFQRETGDQSLQFVLSAPFSRRVNSGYLEVNLPLLSERQGWWLVHALSVDGAIRRQDFSDIGAHTTTSRSTLYQPVSWMSLRASRAEGFKAPRLYDLMAPVFETVVSLDESSQVFDNLRNNEPLIGAYAITSGGQPHLNPETSVSRDYGVILQPPFVEGLALSIDHWRLQYRDRAGTPTFQVLIDYFPDRVFRAFPEEDFAGPGQIIGFDSSNINMSTLNTKGTDYRVNFERDFGLGRISLAAALSDQSALVTTVRPGAAPSILAQPTRGTLSLFWSRGAWDGGVVVNHQSSFPVRSDVRYPGYTEWNPRIAWVARGREPTQLSLTIINLFNRDPSLSDAAHSRIVMDPRLRRYILSISKNF